MLVYIPTFLSPPNHFGTHFQFYSSLLNFLTISAKENNRQMSLNDRRGILDFYSVYAISCFKLFDYESVSRPSWGAATPSTNDRGMVGGVTVTYFSSIRPIRIHC